MEFGEMLPSIGGSASEELKAFVIMPFAVSFDDVYNVIKQAVSSVDPGLSLVRLDEIAGAGRISGDLVHEISTATLCIADVTGGNANVMWEVGFATALKKPLVILNQKGNELPFDIVDLRAVMYEREALTRTLKAPLIKAIRETLMRYSTANAIVTRKIKGIPSKSIAVTGTMDCAPDKVRSRLQKVLYPYLGSGVDWLLGSFGTVDEVTARLLIEAGEKVTIVGYSAYDISGPMLSILERAEGSVFLDANEEQIPAVRGAPSARDVLLASRCDTVIIVWDGVSVGTRHLINWLAQQNKDHLVAFVSPLRSQRKEHLIR